VNHIGINKSCIQEAVFKNSHLESHIAFAFSFQNLSISSKYSQKTIFDFQIVVSRESAILNIFTHIAHKATQAPTAQIHIAFKGPHNHFNLLQRPQAFFQIFLNLLEAWSFALRVIFTSLFLAIFYNIIYYFLFLSFIIFHFNKSNCSTGISLSQYENFCQYFSINSQIQIVSSTGFHTLLLRACL